MSTETYSPSILPFPPSLPLDSSLPSSSSLTSTLRPLLRSAQESIIVQKSKTDAAKKELEGKERALWELRKLKSGVEGGLRKLEEGLRERQVEMEGDGGVEKDGEGAVDEEGEVSESSATLLASLIPHSEFITLLPTLPTTITSLLPTTSESEPSSLTSSDTLLPRLVLYEQSHTLLSQQLRDLQDELDGVTKEVAVLNKGGREVDGELIAWTDSTNALIKHLEDLLPKEPALNPTGGESSDPTGVPDEDAEAAELAAGGGADEAGEEGEGEDGDVVMEE